MSLYAFEPAGDHSSRYLSQLDALIAEMKTGMDAIATNSLDTLKESVSSQEALCAGLAAICNADGDRLRQLSQSGLPPSEDAVELTIWQASNTIRQLNRQYDALLKHSSKTVAMLSALCDNHTGRATEPQATRCKQQTWSCDI